MSKRAVIYMRVSDDQGGRSRSDEQQAKAMRKTCAANGWRVVSAYDEPDRSASRFAKQARPEWRNLLAGLRTGRFDVIVLWEPSRGDRTLTTWSQFLDLCRARDVLIHVESHHHTYDLSNPRDWKALAEDGIDSAWESEKTSMRIKRDVADAAQRGRPHGKRPYGYVRRYDPETGRLAKQEPDPITAPVVREIITRIATNDPVSSIYRDLNRRGIPSPTGGKWARATITRMVLEGVVYIGKRRHNGGPLLDGDWAPIIAEPVYWKAVSVLSDPARKPVNGGIRPGRARWLLSYIATCAVCDGPLSAKHLPRAGSKQVAYYRCADGHAVMPVDFMDRAVSEAVIKWASRPGVYEAIMIGDDSEVAAARGEAAAERARLAAFEDEAIAGRMSPASFARIAAGIEARVSELEKAANRVANPALSSLLSSGSRSENIRACWEEMPIPSRRRVVSVLTIKPGYLRLQPSAVRGAVVPPDVRRIEMKFMDDTRGRGK